MNPEIIGMAFILVAFAFGYLAGRTAMRLTYERLRRERLERSNEALIVLCETL